MSNVKQDLSLRTADAEAAIRRAASHRKFVPDWLQSVLDAQDLLDMNQPQLAKGLLQSAQDELEPKLHDPEAARAYSILEMYIEDISTDFFDGEIKALRLDAETPKVPANYERANGWSGLQGRIAGLSERWARQVALRLDPSPLGSFSRWWNRGDVGPIEWGNVEDAAAGAGTSNSDDDDEGGVVFGAEMDGAWWDEQFNAPANVTISQPLTEEQELEGKKANVVYLPNRDHLNLVARMREEVFDVLIDRVSHTTDIDSLARITAMTKLLQAVAIAGEKGSPKIRDGRTLKAVAREMSRTLNHKSWGRGILPARVSAFQWGINYARAAQVMNACAGIAYDSVRKPNWPTWTDQMAKLTWEMAPKDADAETTAQAKQMEAKARSKEREMNAWFAGNINPRIQVRAVASWPEETRDSGEDIFEHGARQGAYLAEESSTRITCEYCDGTGFVNFESGEVCPVCEGHGDGEPALLHERFMSLRIYQIVEQKKATLSWQPPVQSFRMDIDAVMKFATWRSSELAKHDSKTTYLASRAEVEMDIPVNWTSPITTLPRIYLGNDVEIENAPELTFPKRQVEMVRSGVVKTTKRFEKWDVIPLVGFDTLEEAEAFFAYSNL